VDKWRGLRLPPIPPGHIKEQFVSHHQQRHPLLRRQDVGPVEKTLVDNSDIPMKTVNSVSGGQTSAYLMKHYPADYNLFALVRINAPDAAPKDPWIKKYVESKIDAEFIATAEEDEIFYTLYDLEQFTGQEIHWVTNPSFDEILSDRGHGILPSTHRRYCTAEMKVVPVAKWIVDNIGEVVEMRLGFRAGEDRRVQAKMDSANADGLEEARWPVGKHRGGRNKWETFAYAKYTFPLHATGVYNDMIRQYWKDKPVRFAERNNCIGCFHRNPILLNLMAKKFPEKYAWFEAQENAGRTKVNKSGKLMSWNCFRTDGSYEDFRQHRTQLTMEDLDGFTDCDSGYCGM